LVEVLSHECHLSVTGEKIRPKLTLVHNALTNLAA
jgi:hypothetical protein